MTTKPICVCIELVSWVNDLARNPVRNAKYHVDAKSGDTLRDVLRGFSQQHPKLHQSLWAENDSMEIGPHIEIIVNDAIMGLEKDLHSPMEGGDLVVLAGQYIGG